MENMSSPQNTLSTEQEQAIVAAARRDIRKFAKLYEYYKNRIFRYVRFRVSSHEEAEDLTSQTFLQAMESFYQYQERGRSFGAWLYRIANNIINDWYRKKKPILLEVEELAKQTNCLTNPNQNEKIDAELQEKQLVFCINQLKEKEQQVIILKTFEELTFQRIAEILGQKESTVKMIYYRGLEKIKKMPRKNFSTIYEQDRISPKYRKVTAK